jgi:predicted glycoside hydrolase/deacetylase ChbG (UPF0249 family)
MKRLIVTADDFGMSDGVCEGIVEAMDRGIVTQTSALVCRPDDAERVQRWAPRVAGGLGVHLQISDGIPCLPPERVPSLVNELGAFPRRRQELKRPDRGEVEDEWRAQRARAQELGVVPMHFDTHHHVHMSVLLLPAIAAVARDARAGARSGEPAHARFLRERQVPCADVCAISFFGEELDETRFANIVDRAFASLGGSGTVEVATHPGRADALLAQRSYYVDGRDLELRILTSPSLRTRLVDRGIELVAMSSLIAEALPASPPATDLALHPT